MLINLTDVSFDSLTSAQKEKVIKKYGTVLEFKLPVAYKDKHLEQLGNEFFTKVAAAFDSCANEPKQNAVCMNIATSLEKKLLNLFMISQINVILNCWD